MQKQRNIAKTSLNYNYFLRFSTQIFSDFWPQATLTPARAASQFSSLSSLSHLFAIPKSIILRKQCGNSENNAETSLNYNYYLRFSTQIFPNFWPQATLNPTRSASQFSSLSSLSRLFAIPKSIILRKQCGNSGNNAEIFSRIFKIDFPRFLASGHPIHRPQAAPNHGRRPSIPTSA